MRIAQRASNVERVDARLETVDHGLAARVLVRLAAAVGTLVCAHLSQELVGQRTRDTTPNGADDCCRSRPAPAGSFSRPSHFYILHQLCSMLMLASSQ